MDVVCGSDTPKDQTPGNKNNGETEEPKTVFGLHDALVPSRQLEDEPVSHAPSIQSSRLGQQSIQLELHFKGICLREGHSDQRRNIRKPNTRGGKPVWLFGKNEGGCAVEDVEPYEVGPVGEPCVGYDRKAQEYKRPKCHFFQPIRVL